MNSDQARQRAETIFQQEERARDGRQAMTEYEARALAIRGRCIAVLIVITQSNHITNSVPFPNNDCELNGTCIAPTLLHKRPCCIFPPALRFCLNKSRISEQDPPQLL